MKIKANFRVEATPCSGFKGVEERHANALMHEIKRHCDVDDARVLYDWECQFCGSDWKSSVDEKGCPLCCDKALKEWEEQNKQKGLPHAPKG